MSASGAAAAQAGELSHSSQSRTRRNAESAAGAAYWAGLHMNFRFLKIRTSSGDNANHSLFVHLA